MPYRAILFDADGITLLSKRFSEQIQADYGISWEKMEPFFHGPFLQCKLGKADLKEELKKVMNEWGWQKSVEELMEYWFTIGSKPNEAILAIVAELKSGGVNCFLATNQEKYRAEYLRNVVGLKDVFDDLLISADFGHTKDEVPYFKKAYQRINHLAGTVIAKKSVLFVDHEEKNLTAAKTFGFDTYRYHDVDTFKEYILTQ